MGLAQVPRRRARPAPSTSGASAAPRSHSGAVAGRLGDTPDRRCDKEVIMQAPSGERTAPPLPTLLKDRTLAGEWVLDPGQSSIRLTNRSALGLMRANGVFRKVSGNGTVSPDGEVSGTITVAAASIDTRNN